MANDFLSLKEDDLPRKVLSNTDVKVDIDGKTRFRPEAAGRGTVALYVNITLPPPGSAARAALERGVVRTWFQQIVPGAKEPDITGLDNVRRIGLWGKRHLTFKDSWPHSKDPANPWEFCFFIEAWSPEGRPVSVPLEMTTREIKVQGCKP
jgi:hypothetical protein